jgi:hypothetical protein
VQSKYSPAEIITREKNEKKCVFSSAQMYGVLYRKLLFSVPKTGNICWQIDYQSINIHTFLFFALAGC